MHTSKIIFLEYKARSGIFESEGAHVLSAPSRKVVHFILSPVFDNTDNYSFLSIINPLI